jgi:tRNA-binding EMAP/Myf-like protein
MISYEDFKKVEIRAGKILSAEKIPNTDKLLRLVVDFAEFEENLIEQSAVQDSSIPVVLQKIPKNRQIISGISAYFPDPNTLVGKTCMFVTNLEPRIIKGFESNGMILAVSNKDGGFSLLEPNNTILPGTLAS